MVNIISPSDNSIFFIDQENYIKIGAYDIDGTVEQVEIIWNGTSIATLYSELYDYGWNIKNIQHGDYKLTAIATDDDGAQQSKTIGIVVMTEEEYWDKFYEEYMDKIGLDEFTDSRDGNTYRYVTIGNQTWMIDNLAFLPEVSPPTDGSESLPRYYVYGYVGNDVSSAKQTENYSKYGVLYNWEAAKQAVPEGWHLPTADEWRKLQDYLKNKQVESYYDLINALPLMHTNEGGTNDYGFSAVFAGKYYGDNSEGRIFESIGYETYWWSSSPSFTLALIPAMSIGFLSSIIDPFTYNPDIIGASVRCIKD